MAAFISECERTVDEVLQHVRHQQLILNITADYKYYILFCGVFANDRNVIKAWPKYEPAFLSLVAQDGEVGIKRLLQTIGLYFVRRAPDQQKYLDTFMKLLYDQAVFADTLVVDWHSGKVKSDKKSILYDRKAEKEFRPLLDKFVEWLSSAEYGEYGEEDEAPEEETTVEQSKETDAQRK